MNRYIDIDKAIPLAIQAVVDVVGHGISQIDAVNIADKFDEAPTADVVEVVRCKDCKYSRLCTNFLEKVYLGCELIECETVDVDPDHYCGYGERSEG